MSLLRLPTLLFIVFALSLNLPLGLEVQGQGTLKKLPPAGVDIPANEREALAAHVKSLRGKLTAQAEQSPDFPQWSPDVEVLIRAVDLALTQNLFFKKSQANDAKKLLDLADQRLKAAISGERGLKLIGYSASKRDQPQMLVAGYVSKIDHSVQPYGVVLPRDFTLADAKQASRLDVWLHGRGDTKTEIPFLMERLTKTGQYTPDQTIVLHPFGRHCNAFKFAGEVDVFEAMDDLKRRVAIDRHRTSIRGFSMGGAGVWHLSVHYPATWFASNPGAGFVDTLVYQGWQDKTPFPINATNRKLLHLYDVLPWAANLRNTNLIAYSGEIDKQRKAADRVVAKCKELNVPYEYVIGKGMGHKIDPPSQKIIDAQLAQWAGQANQAARDIDFTTYSLRYANAGWLTIEGMQEHWTPANVKASLDTKNGVVNVATTGVTALSIDLKEINEFASRGEVRLLLNGKAWIVEDDDEAQGFQCLVRQTAPGQWAQINPSDLGLAKRPGLQGPIDDAFCDKFIVVLPSKPAQHGDVQRWIEREYKYFQSRWQRLMRGKFNVVRDVDLTPAQIEQCHLICFGDFTSNRYLANVASQIPVSWDDKSVKVAGTQYEASKHAPAFCYPNPANPNRYLVVNSGMTFREFSNTSNSRQIAMLPDWAVLDVTETNDAIYAGGIAEQGFFDENWKVK